MSTSAYLTISVDDGHPTDLKSAELLQKLGLKATFYIPARNPERELMSDTLVRELAGAFELGSHTFNHKPLRDLPDSEAMAEITDGKKWLEDAIGNNVVSFCYPRGKFHSGTARLVKDAGFLGARTCMFNLSDFPRNPFVWGVSTHAYSHSIPVQIRHALLEQNFRGLVNFALTHRLSRAWPEHFQYAVNSVETHGGVAHLYFHSWEIEEQGQWSTLRELLERISRTSNLVRATNGELLRLWQAGNQ